VKNQDLRSEKSSWKIKFHPHRFQGGVSAGVLV
jgi:hypothetical protein